MKRIGLKSLGLLVALLLAIVLAARDGIFDIRRILALQPPVLWMIGFLASLMGFALGFLIKSQRESAQHLGFGDDADRPLGVQALFVWRGKALWLAPRDAEPAWELSRAAYAWVATLSFLLGGFVLLENRSLLLLEHFQRNMSKDYGQICPKEGAAEDALPAKPKPEKFGCELVKKAYALGYTKDLGDCREEAAEAKEEVCTHRQWDEPSAHYSYRLIERFFSGLFAHSPELGKTLDPGVWAAESERLPELARHHADSFGGEPRSSFHIFTDLKAPGGLKEKWRRALHPGHCQDDLRELKFRLAEKGRDPGRQLEDALAHLLFNPAVGRNASYCRLYTVHWEASPTTCEDLVRSGALALRVYGLEETVNGVLERQKREKAFPAPSAAQPEKAAATNLAVRDGAEPVAEPNPAPEADRLSFHCLMSRGTEAGRAAISLDGQSFVVSTALLPPPGPEGLMPPEALLQTIGRAFAPGFTYAQLDRKLPFSLSEERFKKEIARSGEGLQLAKYELLKMSDILAGDQWVTGYPEYMEVYPWQTHLSNFVGRFRRALQREGDEKP